MFTAFFAQTSQLLAQAASNDVFGTIGKTPGLDKYTTGGPNEIGIILLASNIIKLITVVAGVWTLFNLIFAGLTFISSNGDAGAYKKATDLISMSVIGLLIIVSSYAIAGLIGLLFFGDAGYILAPTLCGPGGC